MLRDSGRMLSELRRHVEIMSQRLKWRAELDRVPVHVAERERIEKQIQAADKVLEAAEKKHTDTTMPLMAGLSNVKRALRECDEAKRKLQDTCLDEALLEELHEAAKQLSAALERRTELDNELRTLREWSESDLHESTIVPMPTHADDLRERSKQRAARAERLAGELAEVEKLYAELDARIKPLRERLLEP